MNTTEEILKNNLKLFVYDGCPYDEVRKICDIICALGYTCRFTEHGTIVFMKIVEEIKTIKE